ncbi:MAG: orotate phosphoribosyltransferase [Clostridia bacterium]|nr:orotate phosphoribosyltransferase [Clostridia bacterium]
MEDRAYEIFSSINRDVSIAVIPGHFATKHSHISHCVDMTKVKSQLTSAKAAAKMFAAMLNSTPVDTIISLDRMKMVGAYLAEDLSGGGINRGQNISVISPEINNDKMLLRDNFLPFVKNRHVLILTASTSTGLTVESVAEGVSYYGGEPVAIAAVFDARFESHLPVITLFGTDDVPGFKSYSPDECPLCRAGARVDAVVNSYGYSKII